MTKFEEKEKIKNLGFFFINFPFSSYMLFYVNKNDPYILECDKNLFESFLCHFSYLFLFFSFFALS